MYNTTKAIWDYLSEKNGDDIKYWSVAEGAEAISYQMPIGGTMKEMLFFFVEDSSSFSLRVYNFIPVPENKKVEALLLVNSLNRKSDFMKYYYNMDDNAIWLMAEQQFPHEATDIDIVSIFVKILVQAAMCCDRNYGEAVEALYL